MRPSHVVLSGVLRQVALAFQRAASSAHHSNGAATLYGPYSASNNKFIASWLDSWLYHQFGPPGSPCHPTILACARGLCMKSGEPPSGVDFPSNASNPKLAVSDGNLDASGQSTSPSGVVNCFVPAGAASAGPATPRQQHPRGKSARLHVRPPSGPAPPPTRSLKDKTAKVLSAKAAAAMAAVKAGGGQQPLPREARRQLDAQLAEMPLPPAPYRGRHAAADGPRSVHVTGFYTGHPFTRASAEAVAAKLRNQPLARGAAVAGVYHDHEDALIIMTHGSPYNSLLSSSLAAVPPVPAAAAATAATVSSSSISAAALASTSAPAAAPLGSATATAVAPTATGATAGGVAADVGAPPPLMPAEGSPASAAPFEATDELGPMEAGVDGALTIAPPPPLLAAEASEAAVAAGGASEAPVFGSSVGRGNRQDSPCMAVMLLEYGGVVFFNVPESLQAEALMRVAAVTLPDGMSTADPGMGRPLSRQPPLRGPNRTADTEAWRQVVERLSIHKEEQLIVVDPNMMAGRGTGRWIRKLDDSLHIWAWDSTTLESIARVISQSAAIRYYNQVCEDMLERYETIMPLGYEAPDHRFRATTERLLFWRSRLPLRDLRQMVFKSSGIRVRLDSRLGLRDPPSGTWESARHHAVWDAIRREFELDDRRDALMDKTDLLKQSCLDLISANNESFTKRSELSIILLITVEIVISLTDLHSALSAENVGRAFGWVIDSLGGGLGPADAADGATGAAAVAASVPPPPATAAS
ncbi:hypothetical protein Vretifemale_11989 [Volvox reticuliferus]|uniref:DUF155 domain-containing protein n=1 Tax=Volvox reticuliferus TaxID=1737510 RepID=A0A8J4CL69_9CHLO|nr:hypothetical protein Vretifemale_11989 [Volvox reticuliferus]